MLRVRPIGLRVSKVMSAFVDEVVPFVEVGGRRALTDKQLMEQPWLLDFMRRFSHCFERDERLRCYFYLEGVSNQ